MFFQNFSNEIAILSTNRPLNIPYVHPIVCFMTQVRRILQRPQFQFPPFNFRYLWSRRTDRYAFMWVLSQQPLFATENLSPINVISSSCWNRVLEEDPYLRLFLLSFSLTIQLFVICSKCVGLHV